MSIKNYLLPVSILTKQRKSSGRGLKKDEEGSKESIIINPHVDTISVSSGKEGTTYYFLTLMGQASGLYYALDHVAWLERASLPMNGKMNSIHTNRCQISVQLNKQGQDFVAQFYVLSVNNADSVNGHNFDEQGTHLNLMSDHISLDVTESDHVGFKWLTTPKMAKPHPNISGEGAVRVELDLTRTMQKIEKQYRNQINSLGDDEVPLVLLGVAIATGGSADTFTMTWKGQWNVNVITKSPNL